MSALHSTTAAQAAGAHEMRKDARTHVSWRLRIRQPGRADFQEGRACDVSEGGVGLMCGQPYPVGMLVDLAMAIPDAVNVAIVTCQARVVFASFSGGQCRIGLQFHAPTADLKQRIRSAVSRVNGFSGGKPDKHAGR